MEKTPRTLITVFSIIIILLGFVTNVGNFLVGGILLFMNLRKMNIKTALKIFGWLYIVIQILTILKEYADKNLNLLYPYVIINTVIGLAMLVISRHAKRKESESVSITT